MTVELSWLLKNEVETRLSKFGVDTNPGVTKVAVETRFSKFGVETNPGVSKVAVETKLRRLGVEINGRIDEANSRGSMKLLMYRSNPATVETSCREEM